jgi:hypothetical protein
VNFCSKKIKSYRRTIDPLIILSFFRNRMAQVQHHPNFHAVHQQQQQRHAGHGGMPAHYPATQNPQQLQAQMHAAHQQQMTAAQVAARTGGNKDEYMKGSWAWVWGLLILFFVIIIIAVAWFLYSQWCGKRRRCGRGGRRGSDCSSSESDECEKPRRCGRCKKVKCCCRQQDDDCDGGSQGDC